jgi:hypothetical protein
MAVTVPLGDVPFAIRESSRNYFKLQIFQSQACPENILGLK